MILVSHHSLFLLTLEILLLSEPCVLVHHLLLLPSLSGRASSFFLPLNNPHCPYFTPMIPEGFASTNRLRSRPLFVFKTLFQFWPFLAPCSHRVLRYVALCSINIVLSVPLEILFNSAWAATLIYPLSRLTSPSPILSSRC